MSFVYYSHKRKSSKFQLFSSNNIFPRSTMEKPLNFTVTSFILLFYLNGSNTIWCAFLRFSGLFELNFMYCILFFSQYTFNTITFESMLYQLEKSFPPTSLFAKSTDSLCTYCTWFLRQKMFIVISMWFFHETHISKYMQRYVYDK